MILVFLKWGKKKKKNIWKDSGSPLLSRSLWNTTLVFIKYCSLLLPSFPQGLHQDVVEFCVQRSD